LRISEIKDQILDIIKSRLGDFQESGTYIRMKEWFEDKPPVVQKIIAWGSLVFTIFLVIFIPYGWMSSSSEYLDNFNSDKQLIREMLQISRDLSQITRIHRSISGGELKGRVTSVLDSFKLLPEQVVENVEKTFSIAESSLAPKGILQNGIQLTLKKINIKQFVDISHKLQTIENGSKLISIDMRANPEDAHYFDATYHVIAFSLPETHEALISDKSEKSDKKPLPKTDKIPPPQPPPPPPPGEN